MDEIHIYNTASGRKELFTPLQEGCLGLYCCGPTVYNFSHIGNLRTYLFEDVLRRTFSFFGYKVSHVMNITDIGHLTDDADDGEDKMLRSAKEQQKSVHQIADFYTKAFLEDCRHLNILRPQTICKATDHIDDMIALIRRIEESGLAYINDGNVYFDTTQFRGYGLGSQAIVDAQVLQARVEPDKAKRSPTDFVLWFTKSKYEHHTLVWDSPWGMGYPGWHLECSAMSMRYLGEQFDVHCGGIDHVSVHHTNEIAQVESVTRRQWVRYWVHGEFLLMNEEKISKSKGRFITLSDLSTNGYSPLDFRYLCLGGHYRSQLQFSLAALIAARNARVHLLDRMVNLLRTEPDLLNPNPIDADQKLSPEGDRLLKKGTAAMANDLNTPQLLSVLWATIKEPTLSLPHKIWLVNRFDAVLGLDIMQAVRARISTEADSAAPRLADVEIDALLEERARARETNEWSAADQIRAHLHAHGVTIVDTSEGSRWFRS